jgi:hypothetical protein
MAFPKRPPAADLPFAANPAVNPCRTRRYAINRDTAAGLCRQPDSPVEYVPLVMMLKG